MAQSYVSHFESSFRILHIPSLWSEYTENWNRPSSTEDVLQLKAGLVMAIGSSLYPQPPDDVAPSFRSTACQWVHNAQQWLSTPTRKARLTTDGLQLQCLLVLASQVLAIGGDLAYIAIGNAVRTAIQMGLHRDPRNFAKMSILEAEVRRRLWATILELNLQASMDAGVPPTVSLVDFDTEAPSNVNDVDIGAHTDTIREYPADVVTDTSLQRFLFGLLRSRYEIVQRINGIPSPMSYDEIHAVTNPLAAACRQRKALTKVVGTEAIFRHNMADLLLRRLLLCLHRPLAGQASPHHQFYFRKISLDAAMAVLSPTHNPEYSHLISVGAGMFKNRMIHASLAVASELLRELEENGPISEPTGYRKMVVDAVQEALRQTEQRIRLGQTNADVKMHMKLSMTLCQAGETGSPDSGHLLRSLAQSAKASLEMSCSILQERLGKPVDERNAIEFQHHQQDLAFDSDVDFYAIFGAMDFDIDALLASDSMLT
ncbi:hypothetical protein H2200_000373 [Cladophialophora chaetospira]|uniref:Xylanolytic transcriptional activator regulatory domain-containing protein n=1 Tax=Cladophialophora chaetospira TaxID=386627 RepID=A0AA38XNE6_9EURO|nr:hypothetical protein H2200_000373 [Cladophialophora chaetospira]